MCTKNGSCEWYQIALAVKCPVVDINRDRNEVVIYGGGVHLSKDRIDRLNGKYGEIDPLKTEEADQLKTVETAPSKTV